MCVCVYMQDMQCDWRRRRTLSTGDIIKSSKCWQSVKIVGALHGFRGAMGEMRSRVSEEGVQICLVDGKS